ncbi:ABC transporter permease [Bacillus thuringiensis]
MKWIKKFTPEDIILSAYVIIFTLMLSMATTYFIKTNEIDKITNDFYSQNNIPFHIKKGNGQLNIKKFFDHMYEKDFILFKENVGQIPYIKGVYKSGNIETPPLVSGRFFQKEDFFQNKNVAVVGRDCDDIIKKNGKSYFKLHDTYFEIIGIMGTDFQTKIDKMVYLNLDSVLSLENEYYGAYVLDGKKDITSTFNSLKHYIDPSVSIEKANKETTGTSRFFENSGQHLGLLILFILAVLSMSVLIFNYWLYKKRILISIQHVIGYSVINIYMNLFKKHLLILISSYFFSTVIFIAFNQYNFKMHLDKYVYYLCIGILILCIYHFLLCIISMLIYSPKKSLKVLK